MCVFLRERERERERDRETDRQTDRQREGRLMEDRIKGSGSLTTSELNRNFSVRNSVTNSGNNLRLK